MLSYSDRQAAAGRAGRLNADSRALVRLKGFPDRLEPLQNLRRLATRKKQLAGLLQIIRLNVKRAIFTEEGNAYVCFHFVLVFGVFSVRPPNQYWCGIAGEHGHRIARGENVSTEKLRKKQGVE
jgi:hypothetical protein